MNSPPFNGKTPFAPPDLDFAVAVNEYLSDFTVTIKIHKQYPATRECYDWCEQHMGVKYRDWFFYQGGSHKDKWTVIKFKDSKLATFFRLYWSDLIIESLDNTE